MNLKKLKNSVGAAGIIALATASSGNLSPARGQVLEKYLYDKPDNFSVQYAQYFDKRLYLEETTYVEHYKILNEGSYEGGVIADENAQQKEHVEIGIRYEKEAELSYWAKLKIFDFRFSTLSLGGIPGGFLDFTSSIPYTRSPFGIGTAFCEGDYGKKQVGSLLPFYVELPLYTQYCTWQSGKWRYANFLASIYFGGSSWGSQKVGEKFLNIFRSPLQPSEQNRYLENPSFGKDAYIRAGLNLTVWWTLLFDPPYIPYIGSMGIDLGIALVEEPQKLKDSIYFSLNITTGSVMWVKLR